MASLEQTKLNLENLVDNIEKISTAKENIRTAINDNVREITGVDNYDCGDNIEDYADIIDTSFAPPVDISLSAGNDYIVNSLYGYDFTTSNYTVSMASEAGQQHNGLGADVFPNGYVSVNSQPMSYIDESRYIDTPVMIIVGSQNKGKTMMDTQYVKKNGTLRALSKVSSKNTSLSTDSDYIYTVNYRDKTRVVKRIIHIDKDINSINGVNFLFSNERNAANVGGYYYNSSNTSDDSKTATNGNGFDNVVGTYYFLRNAANTSAEGTFTYNLTSHSKTGSTSSPTTNDFNVTSDGTHGGTLLYGRDVIYAYSSSPLKYREHPLRLSQLYTRGTVNDPTNAVPLAAMNSEYGYSANTIILNLRDRIADGDTIQYSPGRSFYFKKETVKLYKELVEIDGHQREVELEEDAIVMYVRQHTLLNTINHKCVKYDEYDASTNTIKITEYMYFGSSTGDGPLDPYSTTASRNNDGGSGINTSGNINMPKFIKYLFGLDGSKYTLPTDVIPTSIGDYTYVSRTGAYELSDGGTPITINCSRYNGSQWVATTAKIKTIKLTGNSTNSSDTRRGITFDITLNEPIDHIADTQTKIIGTLGKKIWINNKPDAGYHDMGDYNKLSTASNYLDDWIFLKGSITLF